MHTEEADIGDSHRATSLRDRAIRRSDPFLSLALHAVDLFLRELRAFAAFEAKRLALRLTPAFEPV
jgi:hypothetical protein